MLARLLRMWGALLLFLGLITTITAQDLSCDYDTISNTLAAANDAITRLTVEHAAGLKSDQNLIEALAAEQSALLELVSACGNRDPLPLTSSSLTCDYSLIELILIDARTELMYLSVQHEAGAQSTDALIGDLRDELAIWNVLLAACDYPLSSGDTPPALAVVPTTAPTRIPTVIPPTDSPTATPPPTAPPRPTITAPVIEGRAVDQGLVLRDLSVSVSQMRSASRFRGEFSVIGFRYPYFWQFTYSERGRHVQTATDERMLRMGFIEGVQRPPSGDALFDIRFISYLPGQHFPDLIAQLNENSRSVIGTDATFTEPEYYVVNGWKLATSRFESAKASGSNNLVIIDEAEGTALRIFAVTAPLEYDEIELKLHVLLDTLEVPVGTDGPASARDYEVLAAVQAEAGVSSAESASTEDEPAAPTTAPETVSCPGTLDPLLTIGEEGHVLPGSGNNVRVTPSVQGSRVGSLQPGVTFTVVGGPECADGYLWWQVESGSISGWTVQGDSSDYWVATGAGSRAASAPSASSGNTGSAANAGSASGGVTITFGQAFIGGNIVTGVTLLDVPSDMAAGYTIQVSNVTLPVTGRTSNNFYQVQYQGGLWWYGGFVYGDPGAATAILNGNPSTLPILQGFDMSGISGGGPGS